MTRPIALGEDAGHAAGMPRLLVADDDPLSLAYLAQAAALLGWEVATAADGPAALDLARTERFDALLLDLAMPGGGARTVLAALRRRPQAASAQSPALACSAALDARTAQALCAEGFAAALAKPLRLADLGAALEPFAPLVLDTRRALDACGDAAILATLRGLFRAELDALPAELARLSADPPALRERLHRLRGSCGFCGATRLDAACAEAAAILQQEKPIDLAALQRAVAATRAALAPGD